MNSERNRATIAPSTNSRRNSDSLYMVFRVTNNGLVEMSSVAQPIGDAQSTSQEHNGHQSVGPPGVMRNTFRHPRPCGECSAKKVKCIPLPSNASLCVRCVSRGLPQCPPHVPWSARRGHTDTRSVTRDSQDTASAAANHQHSRTNSISSTSTQSEYASTQYGLYYTPENTIDPSSYASGSDLTSGAMRPDYGSEPTGGFMLPYTYSADPAAYNLDEFAMQTFYSAGNSSVIPEQSSFQNAAQAESSQPSDRDCDFDGGLFQL